MTTAQFEQHIIIETCCDCLREFETRQYFPRELTFGSVIRSARRYHRCAECTARYFRSHKLAVSFRGEVVA